MDGQFCKEFITDFVDLCKKYNIGIAETTLSIPDNPWSYTKKEGDSFVYENILKFEAILNYTSYMNKRFELEEMSREDRCSVVDNETGIHCIWEKGNFNETQEFIGLPYEGVTAQGLSKAMRELGDWLVENHRELL